MRPAPSARWDQVSSSGSHSGINRPPQDWGPPTRHTRVLLPDFASVARGCCFHIAPARAPPSEMLILRTVVTSGICIFKRLSSAMCGMCETTTLGCDCPLFLGQVSQRNRETVTFPGGLVASKWDSTLCQGWLLSLADRTMSILLFCA